MTSIKIDHLAKIYGHAGLELKIRGKRVERARVNITESSRLFENMVSGKRFDEARRLTSRICGICAASHNLTSIMAAEDALGIDPPEDVRRMREALILGGWIQSHALHLYFLALPDYLGYGGTLEMADDRPNDVDRAFRLKKLGNDILAAIGGRPTHLITTQIGGFTRVPGKDAVSVMLKSLKKGLKDAITTAGLFSSFDQPEYEREKPFGALAKKGAYPILTGTPVIGHHYVDSRDFAKKTITEDKNYSTSKFVSFNGEEFMVGPLARLNTSHRYLSPEAKACFRRSDLTLPDHNPFNANVARAIELVHCVEKCIEVLESIRSRGNCIAPDPRSVAKALKRGMHHGAAVTEAPRGMLYHEYDINGKGFITRSNIITPTSQNLYPIERDVKAFLPSMLGKPKQELILEIEKLIRSYDPCISCATHFLDVRFV